MDGLPEQFLSFSDVLAGGFEGGGGGFEDSTDSNVSMEKDGESHNVFDDMVEVPNVGHGMDVNLSNFVGGDGLAEEMLRIENEIFVPKVGKKFADETEVFEFYKRYAYQVGFPVRKGNTKRGPYGIVWYVSFTRSREGRRNDKRVASLNPAPTIETGCKARLTACSDACGIFQINVVHLEHNHKTSSSKSRLYRCNRQLSEHVKRRLEVNDITGIPVHKSFNSTVLEAGGFDNMTCVEKDCRNFIEKVRRLRLGEGDATAIQAYFSRMQARCPGFSLVWTWMKSVA